MVSLIFTLIILALYTAVGFVTALKFRSDKKASENNEWRTPERTLLSYMWLFGVYGAAIGMHVFKHKTNKPLFNGNLTLALVVHTFFIFWSIFYIF